MGEGIPPFYQGGGYMAGSRKCHLCKEYIKDEEPIIKEHITINGNRQLRFLHSKCEVEYDLRVKENKAWDILYQYVRKEIFQYNQKQPLSNEQVKMLRSFRAGEMIRHGTVIPINNEGFSYETILITFKLLKNQILKSIEKKEFDSESAKTKYIAVIISNHIMDVHKRIQFKKQQSDQLEEIKVEVKDSNFQSQSDKKDKKKLFDDMW